MLGGEIDSKLEEKEKGYLMGLYLGDGYSHHDEKNRHYTTEFYLNSVKDLEIKKYLIKILKKMSLNAIITKDKRYNCNRIRVRSKDLFYYISKMKFKNNNEFDLGLVSGLIDSDGYVNKKKSFIQIVNTNKQLLERIELILKKIDVNATLKKRVKSKKDKLDSYSLYISFKFIKTSNNSIKAQK
jgi:hypothetical protein